MRDFTENHVKADIMEIREKTRDDVISKLARYGKCLIIRPTGYGKTFLMTDLVANYGKVLYLYPAEVIADTVRQRYVQVNADTLEPDTIENIAAMKSFANVDMMTYAMLIRVQPSEFASMGYDCVIADEAHRLGAKKTARAISQLTATLPGAHFIGATATPNRTDAFDVAGVFFSNVTSFPYTLHDAIMDGMLCKPNYCYCTYDVETDLKEAALTAGEDLKDPEVLEVLNRKLIEISEIYNMPNVIRTMCERFTDTSYMKFIVFFSSMAHMNEKLPAVTSWFHEAFPGHEIGTLRISSLNRDETENVKRLDELRAAPGRIDLIGCIDMLNMGYHVSDLTGIVMYRGTKSDIIYVQQLGRALSSGSNRPALVFDVVDNLHRKAVYDLTEDNAPRARARATQAEATPWKVNGNGCPVDDRGLPAPIEIKPDGTVTDLQGNRTSMKLDASTGRIMNEPDKAPWYRDANRITARDVERIDLTSPLYANGKLATYREIIAKAVAEPMSQRCRMAIALHFRKWCESMRIPYPIAKSELDAMDGVSSDGFLAYFKSLLADNRIDYPLQDAEALLAFGEDDTDDIPLRICAKAKNVSVRAILDLLELT